MYESKRLYFLDGLRVIIILLVIVLHSSIAFLTPVFPNFIHYPRPDKNFWIIVLFLDSCVLMPPMFFAAGFFMPKSMLKNGPGFIKGKLLRLGIPLIAGSVVLAPLLKAMASYSDGQAFNFIGFIISFFQYKNFSQFHFWFLGILMTFFLITAIFYSSFKSKKDLEQEIQSKPSFAMLAGLFIITTILSLFINLFVKHYVWTRLYIIEFQTIKIPVYFCYFLLGIYAYRKKWFEKGFTPNIFIWVPIFLISSIIMIIIIVNNIYDTILWKLLYNSTSCLQTMSFFFTIIAVSRKTLDRDTPFLRNISRSSFAVYIIHLNILFTIQYLTRNIMIPSFIKFLLQAALTVILSWITASFIIRIPGLKAVLDESGGKNRKGITTLI